jgi:hypothetical protein
VVIEVCAWVAGGLAAGLVLFGATAYLALMWFDLPTLIEEF